MNTADIAVVAAAVTASLGLLWFFFGSRTAAHVAERQQDVQRVTVVRNGGYDPQRIQAVAGIPLQIDFDRRESGDCTSRVVFPELGIGRFHPPPAAEVPVPHVAAATALAGAEPVGIAVGVER